MQILVLSSKGHYAECEEKTMEIVLSLIQGMNL